MRFPPPSVIATWPPANHVNPENRGPALLIVEFTILPVALICLALRLYVRIFVVRRSGWDDWLMVGAAVFGIGVTICVVLGRNVPAKHLLGRKRRASATTVLTIQVATQLYGWNIHVWDLTYLQMTQGRQVSIAGQALFVFASGLAKASILMSYLRIAPRASLFRKGTLAGMAVVVAAMPIFLIVLWTQCK